ncbi:hypothetical protein [Streptococcus suis]|uniref:Uncharacterized protein n=3 Tax=Streptococcus suis TaxID=1307 RepID=A0A426T4B8_STRSU|nr:hypothetical protein [Streptococcus suis]MBY4965171.1 hypothetical protein [Streptococcus suis]MDW8777729.1 hypothetical protein [Streptococcus suis]RRN52499.1 hypothetical protein EI220_01345 [Streptococcus suis]RRR48784.1 hypothetical protein EJA00_06105 [Streptococcus suis]TII04182.1 hypothetical protein FAJ35_00025 [Streptococcus suis]
MFITEAQFDPKKEHENKDSLMHYLESSSAKLAIVGVTEELIMRHILESGEEVESRSITLPIKVRVEELLADFGNTKEKRKGRFGKSVPVAQMTEGASEFSNGQNTDRVKEQDLTTAVSAPPKSQIMISVLTLFLVLGSIALSTYTLLGLQSDNTKIQELSEQVAHYQLVQQKQPAVDLFSRYFLPAYFSGQEKQVKKYLAEELAQDLPELPSGQLQSVILESLTVEEEQFQLTYVVVVKDAETVSNYRLNFTVQEDEKSEYGYQVTSLPKQESYP